MQTLNAEQRLMRLMTANPATLAKVDAVLIGTDGQAARADEDCRLVTYTEAARRLNVSRPTVYRLARLGRIEIVPLDGVSRIRLRSLISYANNVR